MASLGSNIGQPWRALWAVLHVVLPPFPQEDVLHPLLTSAPHWGAMGGSIAWCVGYGCLSLAAAALVIKGLEWGR
jgi:hypothetical protein